MIPLFLSSGLAAIVALVGSWWVARLLRSYGRSQPILQRNADNIVVPDHQHKAGTPTMGGVLILGSVLVTTLVCARPLNPFIAVCSCTMLALGLLALSSHPALRALGVTTGLGVGFSLVLAPAGVALLGSRSPARSRRS